MRSLMHLRNGSRRDTDSNSTSESVHINSHEDTTTTRQDATTTHITQSAHRMQTEKQLCCSSDQRFIGDEGHGARERVPWPVPSASATLNDWVWVCLISGRRCAASRTSTCSTQSECMRKAGVPSTYEYLTAYLTGVELRGFSLKENVFTLQINVS